MDSRIKISASLYGFTEESSQWFMMTHSPDSPLFKQEVAFVINRGSLQEITKDFMFLTSQIKRFIESGFTDTKYVQYLRAKIPTDASEATIHAINVYHIPTSVLKYFEIDPADTKGFYESKKKTVRLIQFVMQSTQDLQSKATHIPWSFDLTPELHEALLQSPELNNDESLPEGIDLEKLKAQIAQYLEKKLIETGPSAYISLYETKQDPSSYYVIMHSQSSPLYEKEAILYQSADGAHEMFTNGSFANILYKCMKKAFHDQEYLKFYYCLVSLAKKTPFMLQATMIGLDIYQIPSSIVVEMQGKYSASELSHKMIEYVRLNLGTLRTQCTGDSLHRRSMYLGGECSKLYDQFVQSQEKAATAEVASSDESVNETTTSNSSSSSVSSTSSINASLASRSNENTISIAPHHSDDSQTPSQKLKQQPINKSTLREALSGLLASFSAITNTARSTQTSTADNSTNTSSNTPSNTPTNSFN